MNDMLRDAKELKADIIADRRELHRHPELNGNLEFTSAYVMDRLREMGYSPARVAGCGVVAQVGREGNKVFLLRADMDALPMKETSGEPFAAEGQVSHSCGHDCHTAMLLGAAKLLKTRERELSGTVRLMFQPDEEGLTGARDMVEAGVLENPPVDATMALHVSIGRRTGVAAVSYGTVMASCDRFTIEMHGKGCHGADPQTGVDPINMMAHIFLSLQTLTCLETAPGENAVLTVGCVHAGTAPNIIPGEAVMEGTLRCFNPEVRQRLLRRLEEVSRRTAEAFGGDCTVSVTGSVPPVSCSDRVSEAVEGYLKELIGEENTKKMPGQCGGSEDFAYVLERVPGTYLALGCGNEEEGYHYNVHHPSVRFNEDSLHVGAAAYAYCAMRWLEEH